MDLHKQASSSASRCSVRPFPSYSNLVESTTTSSSISSNTSNSSAGGGRAVPVSRSTSTSSPMTSSRSFSSLPGAKELKEGRSLRGAGSSPLAGRSPLAVALTLSSSSSFSSSPMAFTSLSMDDKVFRITRPSKAAAQRLWLLAQGLLLALLLVLFCSMLLVTLFSPRLAIAAASDNTPQLILLHRGGHRLVMRSAARGMASVQGGESETVDPVADLSHPRNAGRREMMKFFVVTEE